MYIDTPQLCQHTPVQPIVPTTLYHSLQSDVHQEYQYHLKWRGYGEEENSWVPASSMNCWELLQAYLSKNIFNNPNNLSSKPTHSSSAASSSSKPTSVPSSKARFYSVTPAPSKLKVHAISHARTKSKIRHSNSSSSKLKSHSKPKTVKPKLCEDSSSPKDILVSNTLHSTSSRGTLRLHLSDTATNTATTARSVPSIKLQHRHTTDRHRGKKTGQFSTPKRLPSSVRFSREQRQQKLTSSPGRHNAKVLLKQRKIASNGKIRALASPSVSPLLSSCDDSSSQQSDGSVSIDESFQLHLDSDEDSSVSGNRSLSGENPLLSTEQPRTNYNFSPKIRLSVASSLQKQHVSNGLNHSLLQLPGKLKPSSEKLQSGAAHPAKCRKTVFKKNGFVQPAPTSTTQSTTENSSDSESWSKTRLRKRAHSSSPSPSPSPDLASSHGSSSACSITGGAPGSSNGQAEVTSTTSPLITKGFNHPFTLPLTSALISLASQSTEQVPTKALFPHQQSPNNADYQQELLEWQFMLNKQCRPTEAFILVENHIDEAPVPWGFKYITSNQYGEGVPDPKSLEVASRICGCTCYYMGKKCGARNQHCCPKMAGAEFPYTLAGKIRIPPGNPIYECNSHCSCPQDCVNRVVQRGRKINMSIFRTSNGRGWGVKTMEPIKPNTFVTEYVGEVVTTEDAERRGELYDQEGRTYLFDLDFNCDDNAFTIDAAHYGNISHFFNHSVSPTKQIDCVLHHCSSVCIVSSAVLLSIYMYVLSVLWLALP